MEKSSPIAIAEIVVGVNSTDNIHGNNIINKLIDSQVYAEMVSTPGKTVIADKIEMTEASAKFSVRSTLTNFTKAGNGEILDSVTGSCKREEETTM